jgi:hypothetical protein
MPAPRQILGGLMVFGGVMWLLVSRMLAAPSTSPSASPPSALRAPRSGWWRLRPHR